MNKEDCLMKTKFIVEKVGDVFEVNAYVTRKLELLGKTITKTEKEFVARGSKEDMVAVKDNMEGVFNVYCK